MNKPQKFLRFLLLLFFSFLIIGFIPRSSEIVWKEFIANNILQQQSQPPGSSMDFLLKNSRNGQPLEGYVMHIIDKSTGTLTATMRSDESGVMKTGKLEKEKEYQLKIIASDKGSEASMVKEEVMYTHQSPDSSLLIETYVEREANHIGVPVMLQNPELPNGCEITTLTSILNYHGAEISKTEMADDYLPKSSFKKLNGKKVGPDPHLAYAGDPRMAKGGWYVFAEPIVAASKKILDKKSSRLISENISGSSQEEILSYTDQNIPVIVWVTLDLSPPIKSGGWYIEGTEEFHPSFINLHTVVLDGWENGNVYVMDPLQGRISYPEDLFFESYKAMGSQAVIVKR